jgi:hypothetical protein
VSPMQSRGVAIFNHGVIAMHNLNLIMLVNKAVTVFIIFVGLLCNSASTVAMEDADAIEKSADVVVKSCEEAQRWINNIQQDAELFAKVEYYKSLYDFANSSAGSNCSPWLIERIYFEYGSILLNFAKSQKPKQKVVTNFSNQAAVVFTKYIQWWEEELDETAKNNIILSSLKGLDLKSKEGERKRNNWIRSRPGGILKLLIEARELTMNFENLLTDLENFGQQDIYIFNQESVQAWDKWLTAQNDFTREKNDKEIRDLNATCDICKGRWEIYGKFLDEWLKLNTKANSVIKSRKASLSRLIALEE